jgi:recombination protein RecR
MAYPAPLEALVEAFQVLPGIGRRTAERLALHILRDPKARVLGQAIDAAIRDTKRCSICRNVCEVDPCPICADSQRNPGQLLVVEEPTHVQSVERAGVWQGRYHVLLGSFNPAEGTEARHLAVGGLIDRLRAAEGDGSPIEEVVLGMDPDKEGEATLLLVLEAIESAGLQVKVSRLSRGLPAGSGIEYLHRGVLEDAIEERRPVRRS